MSVNLIAIKPVFGDYIGGSATGVRKGLIQPGETFTASDSDAESLEARGLAERYHPPYVPAVTAIRFPPEVDTFKQVYPPENKMMPAIKATKRK